MKFLENLGSARELSRKICLHYKRVKFLQLAFSHTTYLHDPAMRWYV